MKTINVILRSTFWGQGKTVGALSYRRPDNPNPKRLVFDREYRDQAYQSKTDEDDPERLLFAFDLFRDTYGDFDAGNLRTLYRDITEGEFFYDVLIVDNATMWQEELFSMMAEKQEALAVAKAFEGVYNRNRLFLDHRFKPTDPGGYYTLLKSVIRALLLACRKNGVDVILTCESKNVWQNYGQRGAKILGQTAKVWDPWFQFADLLLVLNRIEGSREDGTAKLSTYPTAQFDTFNVKASLPGIAPEFVFDSWDVVWDMIEARKVPSREDLAKLKIQKAEQGEDAADTIKGAQRQIAELAVEYGIMKSMKDKDGADKLKALGAKEGLDMDNALAQLTQWVQLIVSQGS